MLIFNFDNEAPYFRAIAKGEMFNVKKMTAEVPSLINLITDGAYRLTPLMVAAIFGQTKMLKWLVDHGGDIRKEAIHKKDPAKKMNLLEVTVRYSIDPKMVRRVLKLYAREERARLCGLDYSAIKLAQLAAESDFSAMLNKVLLLYPQQLRSYIALRVKREPNTTTLIPVSMSQQKRNICQRNSHR
jgi:hypothetical protein